MIKNVRWPYVIVLAVNMPNHFHWTSNIRYLFLMPFKGQGLNSKITSMLSRFDIAKKKAPS